MGTYQYAITKTKKIQDLEDFGDIGVVEFRYKYSYNNEAYEKKCERLDQNIERKWEGKQLPTLVTLGEELYIWVGVSANWIDSDITHGAVSLATTHGFNELLRWESENKCTAPAWLHQAILDVFDHNFRYVPTTKAKYYELVDATCTHRLRARGNLTAQPLLASTSL